MHPGKPEQFPFHCSKCGQGTHNLATHRCIRPGEMHGSRRRRAPRNVVHPPPTNTVTSDADPSLQSVVVVRVKKAPCDQHDERLSENVPTSTTSQAVDCSAVVKTMSPESRPPSLQPLDCIVASSRLMDQTSDIASHVINPLSSPNSQSEVHYNPATSATQSFDRSFNQLSSANPLDRHQLVGRHSYHHHGLAQSQAGAELPYDRRMPPSFQSQQPAMAHQPPQQPPYSNLFAVDPLLQQLRAANMMYRVDY